MLTKRILLWWTSFSAKRPPLVNLSCWSKFYFPYFRVFKNRKDDLVWFRLQYWGDNWSHSWHQLCLYSRTVLLGFHQILQKSDNIMEMSSKILFFCFKLKLWRNYIMYCFRTKENGNTICSAWNKGTDYLNTTPSIYLQLAFVKIRKDDRKKRWLFILRLAKFISLNFAHELQKSLRKFCRYTKPTL